MTSQFTTPLATLLVEMVRCVRSCPGISIPNIPFINPEQKAAQFALEHPQEAQLLVNQLYVLLQNYFTTYYRQ